MAQLGGEIGALTSHRYHHRPLRGDAQPKPVKGLPQERLSPGEYGVLLGPVLAIDVASQLPEPHALAAGQYEGPRVRAPTHVGSIAGNHARPMRNPRAMHDLVSARSEEHTSELQSRGHLVCRLLL